MTLQQLEYVMAVYRCKHFAKAAEYCNVTQPTLSSMIQKLEDELGIKIFDRSKQPIHPTAAGQLVIERAWNILVRAKHLKEIVEEERKSITGTLNVAILPTIAPYLLPRFLPQLMNEYPEMDIRVTEMKTEDIHKALKHGDIDAAILAKLDGLCHLPTEEFNKYADAVKEMASAGLRVLGVAKANIIADTLPKEQHDFECEDKCVQ